MVRRVLIAPDSFKGSIRAAAAAKAIAEGWLSIRPDDGVTCVPMADGGEGTMEALAASVPSARWMPVTVAGPLGDPVDASWVHLPARDGSGGVGVVELAATVGLERMPKGAPLDPLDASSRGFGQAIAAALDAGVDRIVLAIGGSASSDGGAGMLQALGVDILDAERRAIGPGASGVGAARVVDAAGARRLPRGGVTVLTDVDSPLLGPAGAAAVFGPQKGATARQVAQIEDALAGWAALVGTDPSRPGAGAAGGVGYGLLAWGAQLVPGAPAIADLLGLDAAIADADFVVTGEGRFDDQSALGKAAGEVLRRALEAGVTTAVVAGSVEVALDSPTATLSLATMAGGVARAMKDPARWLRRAGETLAAGTRSE